MPNYDLLLKSHSLNVSYLQARLTDAEFDGDGDLADELRERLTKAKERLNAAMLEAALATAILSGDTNNPHVSALSHQLR